MALWPVGGAVGPDEHPVPSDLTENHVLAGRRKGQFPDASLCLGQRRSRFQPDPKYQVK